MVVAVMVQEDTEEVMVVDLAMEAVIGGTAEPGVMVVDTSQAGLH